MRNISAFIAVIFAVIVLAISNNTFATRLPYGFNHLTVSDGLSQGSVYDLIQDDKGLIWIATQGGLNLYDGYRVSTLFAKHNDLNSLPNNYIRALVQNQPGVIWIGTLNGLARLNLKTNQIQAFHISSGNYADHINDIFFDTENRLWVATKGGLFRMETDGDFVEITLPNSQSQVFVINQTSDGSLWLGTNKGLLKMERDEHAFKNVSLGTQDDAIEVHALSVGIYDELWVGSSTGLVRVDVKTGQQQRFIHQAGDADSLLDTFVTALLLDSLGNLWIGGTSGVSRLSSYDWQQGQFEQAVHDIADTRSLSSGRVYSISEDRQGSIWIGTTNGLNVVNPSEHPFTSIKQRNEGRGLSNSNVFGMAEDRNGHVWVGSLNGVTEFDEQWRALRTLHSVPGDHNTLSHKLVFDIAVGPDGDIWLATAKGLDRFNPATGHMKHYRYDEKEPYSLSSERVFTLLFDHQNVLWVGTGWGLNRYDSELDGFHHYFHADDNQSSLTDNEIYALYEDNEYNLWVGTLRGLNRRSQKTGEFQRYRMANKQLINDWVFALLKDKNNQLWVATAGGLTQLDPQSGKAINYDTNDGLPSNALYGILEDESGNLWLSSNRGIVRFNPSASSGEKITLFNPRHGAAGWEFNFESFLKKSDGQLVFGGTEGLSYLNPKNIPSSDPEISSLLTRLIVNNHQVPLSENGPLTQTLRYLSKIVLQPGQNQLSIEFASERYMSPLPTHYRYRMIGINQNWVSAQENSRYASYTDLPNGNYVFQLQASKDGQTWGPETQLFIQLEPYFYQTWWFRWLMFSILLGGAAIAGFLGLKKREQILRDRQTLQFAQEQSRFFDGIAHEMGNYATIFKANREALQQKKNINLLPVLDQICTFTEDLKKLSETNKKSLLEPVWDPVMRIVKTVIREQQLFATQHGIVLLFQGDTDKELFATQDALKYLLSELIRNGIKYTQKEGRVSLSIQDTDKGLELSVIDTGIGIHKEDQQKIFEKGVRVNELDQNSQYGSGLGLDLVQRLAYKHHWKITLQSEIGTGSRFTILIPAQDLRTQQNQSLSTNNEESVFSDDSLTREVLAAEVKEPYLLETQTVLIVEDEPGVRDALKLILSDYQLLMAEDGEAGIAMAMQHQPDLIISDLNMPNMDG
ncbi:MAG: response regulator, partial [Oceanospirillaceae bacterium]|nr:response regulator [Oceanospirillaceae bacterium]